MRFRLLLAKYVRTLIVLLLESQLPSPQLATSQESFLSSHECVRLGMRIRNKRASMTPAHNDDDTKGKMQSSSRLTAYRRQLHGKPARISPSRTSKLRPQKPTRSASKSTTPASATPMPTRSLARTPRVPFPLCSGTRARVSLSPSARASPMSKLATMS